MNNKESELIASQDEVLEFLTACELAKDDKILVRLNELQAQAAI